MGRLDRDLGLTHNGVLARVPTPGLRCRVWGVGFWGVKMRKFERGLRISSGVETSVWGSGCRVWGLGLRVQDLGFSVEGLGFRVEGSGMRVKRLPRPPGALPIAAACTYLGVYLLRRVPTSGSGLRVG